MCNQLNVTVICWKFQDWEGKVRYAQYGFFTLSNELNSYKLLLDNYSGDAGDSLRYHNNTNFSTKNKDNDKCVDDCAALRKGKLATRRKEKDSKRMDSCQYPTTRIQSSNFPCFFLQVVTGTTAALTQT